MKQTGIIVLVVGIALTIFTTFTFFTREEIVNVGPIHVAKDEPHTSNWSPLLGVGVMLIGGVLLWHASKK